MIIFVRILFAFMAVIMGQTAYTFFRDGFWIGGIVLLSLAAAVVWLILILSPRINFAFLEQKVYLTLGAVVYGFALFSAVVPRISTHWFVFLMGLWGLYVLFLVFCKVNKLYENKNFSAAIKIVTYHLLGFFTYLISFRVFHSIPELVIFLSLPLVILFIFGWIYPDKLRTMLINDRSFFSKKVIPVLVILVIITGMATKFLVREGSVFSLLFLAAMVYIVGLALAAVGQSYLILYRNPSWQPPRQKRDVELDGYWRKPERKKRKKR